jgi:hypothetical protein
MKSQRRREGLLTIDHRAGIGMGAKADTALGHGTLFEAPTYTCSHCQRVVVVNPDRSRDRAYCRKCDHIICDQCEAQRVAAGWECIPFEKVADDMLERATRNLIPLPPANPIFL